MRHLDKDKRRLAQESLTRLLRALAHLHPDPGKKGVRRCGGEVLARLMKVSEHTTHRWWAREGYVPLSKAARCARIARRVGLDITKEQLAPDLAD